MVAKSAPSQSRIEYHHSQSRIEHSQSTRCWQGVWQQLSPLSVAHRVQGSQSRIEYRGTSLIRNQPCFGLVPTWPHSPQQSIHRRNLHYYQHTSHVFLEEDEEPHNLEKDEEPHNLEKDEETHNLEEDEEPHNLEKDEETHNLEEDEEPHNLEKDEEPHNLEKDEEPHNLEKDEEPHNLEKDEEAQDRERSAERHARHLALLPGFWVSQLLD
ncbi:hypothetical protein T484DRAFT_1986609 [Baffinella frigidus]|nr:hypothetical protein T484DRAFT_1986609 [Cryptophyta sp. CCMP2293]